MYLTLRQITKLRLAESILNLPRNEKSSSKVQAFLFSLIHTVIRNDFKAVLAPNQSSAGLLNGLYGMVERYNSKLMYDHSEKGHRGGIRHSNHDCIITDQDEAAAYYSLRTLEAFSRNYNNQLRIIQHIGFQRCIIPLLPRRRLPKRCLISILRLLQKTYYTMHSLERCNLPLVIFNTLLARLVDSMNAQLSHINSEISFPLVMQDTVVFSTMLYVVNFYSQAIRLGSSSLSVWVTLVGKLFCFKQFAVDTVVLYSIIDNLLQNFPFVACNDQNFTRGVLHLYPSHRFAKTVLQTVQVMQHKYKHEQSPEKSFLDDEKKARKEENLSGDRKVEEDSFLFELEKALFPDRGILGIEEFLTFDLLLGSFPSRI